VLFLGETITGKEVIGLVAAGLGTLIVQLRQLPTSSRVGWPTRVSR
jgi:drug/metabolite transporter (DMT)-like permease